MNASSSYDDFFARSDGVLLATGRTNILHAYSGDVLEQNARYRCIRKDVIVWPYRIPVVAIDSSRRTRLHLGINGAKETEYALSAATVGV